MHLAQVLWELWASSLSTTEVRPRCFPSLAFFRDRDRLICGTDHPSGLLAALPAQITAHARSGGSALSPAGAYKG